MTKPTIAVVVPLSMLARTFPPADRHRLEALGDVAWTDAEEKTSPEEAIELLQGREIGIGSWGTPNPATEGLLGACPELKLWIHAAGSVKGIVRPVAEAIRERGLVVASCAPAIAEQVAETTLGELIVGVRRILENAAANRNGKARRPENCLDLEQATIGVLGASQVGRRVIRNLQPFGPRILVYDPYLTDEGAAELGVERRDAVTEVCRECHALTIHAPANPDCRHMVGPEQLAAMRDDCVIVNTARGMIVDEAALIEELSKGRFFAFLDVTDPEPAPEDSPLRRLPNVVLTSHIAGGPTPKIGGQVVRDVEAWTRGEPPEMAVAPEDVQRIA